MIEHVKAGGKNRPYLLSYKAVKKLSANSEGNSFDSLEQAAYAAFYSGHYKENPGKEPDFKPSDMADWFDDDFNLLIKVKDDIMDLTALIEGKSGNMEPLPEKGNTSTD